ncbi:MAG: SdrD B-like domain-containing protein [Caldilineaceae bacterium]
MSTATGQYADKLDANGDNTDHGTSLSALGVGLSRARLISPTVGNQPAGEGNEGNEPIQTNNDANSNQTIDFGFYQLVLGNRIWIDENNNGLDDGEPALATTLTVTATNQSTGDVHTTTTDANGYYTFTGIVSGTYVVSFEAPLGYVSSSTDGTPNGADLDDNGVGHTGGLISSEPFALVPGTDIAGVQSSDDMTGTTTNPSVDFGLWEPLALGNRVWYDTNDNGQMDGTEVGTEGVVLTRFRRSRPTGAGQRRALHHRDRCRWLLMHSPIL